MFFLYDHFQFQYEPFPIGWAKPLMAETVYQEFLDNYPSLDIFKSIPKVGNKYSLSERFNPKEYADFVRSSPVWKEFHHWIKSDEFVNGIMDMLREHHIDLGYGLPPLPRKQYLLKFMRNLKRGKILRSVKLGSRFEFSMLPATGGHVLPHTDAPSKIVTMIVSMLREGEWNPAFGGGTDVNRPKTIDLSFNRLNRKADFEDMEVLNTYGFNPNQGVLFVKTFNSWHSVRPMTGVDPEVMRKTLTINIELAD